MIPMFSFHHSGVCPGQWGEGKLFVLFRYRHMTEAYLGSLGFLKGASLDVIGILNWRLTLK